MQFLLQGGTALVHAAGATADWRKGDLLLQGASIGHIGGTTTRAVQQATHLFDASGLLVLPGIVDLHGDAFERQLQPRPSACFSHDIALADTDRQLVANGITTACHGAAYSWEGGLRGRDSMAALIEQVARQRDTAHADHRIHLRFENHHVDGLADALQWIERRQVDFVAFNDHLPSIAAGMRDPASRALYVDRARCAPEVFAARLAHAQSQAGRVAHTIETLASACRAHAIPMASHDDRTVAEREYYHALGVGISEFPRTQDALFAAMIHDNRVLMGAPNVLLGRSRCGGLAAVDAIKSGMCDMLVSDYYYPSLLHAPFRLAQEGICSLPAAWQLVSANPAAALGLHDRGRIAPGCRADLVIVEPGRGTPARLIATIAAGRLAYCAQPERFATQRAYSLAA